MLAAPKLCKVDGAPERPFLPPRASVSFLISDSIFAFSLRANATSQASICEGILLLGSVRLLPRAREGGVSAFLVSQIFSDKIGHSECVYLREFCKVPIPSKCG